MVKRNSLIYDSKLVGKIFLGLLIFISLLILFQSIDLNSTKEKNVEFNINSSNIYNSIEDYRSLNKFSEINSLLITIYIALLGFFITTITILFMFDSKTNKVLNKIKRSGLYEQIFERVSSTIIITFISFITTIIFYFISLKNSFMLFEIITLYLLSLVLVRAYRVIYILYLIQNSMDMARSSYRQTRITAIKR